VLGSLDLARFPLGVAQREVLRTGQARFAAGASFSRRLLGIRLQSVPLPVPQFTIVGHFGIWPSGEALASFRAGSLADWEEAGERLSLTLRPLQSFGAWAGVDPLEGHRSEPAEGPVLLVTHSRTHARNLPRFLWTDGPVVRTLGRAPGRLWSGGFMDGVRTIDTGTMSLWRSTEDATRFAYAPGVHQSAVKAEREGGWFSESWFARFAVAEASGDWCGLDAAALSLA